MNYRSVVILGEAHAVAAEGKAAALKVISDQIIPGRWETQRPVTPNELDQTIVLQLDIVEASAKLRSGPPVDDEEDYALPIWAGTLDFAPPLATPNPDKRLKPGVATPAHVTGYRRVKS